MKFWKGLEGKNKLRLYKIGIMKKYLILISLILSIFAIVEVTKGIESDGNDDIEVIKEPKVMIERIDYSIKSEKDEILAYIYYEMPVIESIEYSDKINSFYEKEMEGWLNGANRLTHYQNGWLQDFKSVLSEARESLGDEIISKQPFLYTVNSEVTLVNKDYMSIRQIVTIQTAGKPSYYYFGSTFDLQSGELVSIDKLININVDEFRDTIVEFLSENIMEYNHNLTYDDLRDVYGANSDVNYQIKYDNEIVDLKYEFYYDGVSFFVILNHATLIDKGIIMKWNGKLGEDFDAQLIGYMRNDDGTYKLVEY